MLDNLDEIDKFLDKKYWNSLKNKQNLDRLLANKKADLVIKFTTKKSPSQISTWWILSNIKRININPSQTLPKNKREGNIFQLSLQGLITRTKKQEQK